MKRRSFLKSLGAGAGFILLPEIAFSLDTSIHDCADLTAAMEDMFICRVGVQNAFMDLTVDQARKLLTPNAYANALLATNFFTEKEEEKIRSMHKMGTLAYNEAVNEITPPNGIIRLIYLSFGYAIEGGDPKEAERKLANYFYDQFKKLNEGDKKLLIWRIKPEFSSSEVTYFGRTWMTKEQIEDRIDLNEDLKIVLEGYTHPTYGQINRWAFTVPRDKDNEPPIMVPEGVEYDFDSGQLRYVDKKTMLHKIRMRLVMPEVQFEEDQYREAGSVYKRI